MWNVNSSIVNTRPLDVLIIKVCHCNVLFSGLICSQHAIEMDLVSPKAPKNPDSNDSSPISVSLKTKVIQVFLHPTQPEQTIIVTLIVKG